MYYFIDWKKTENGTSAGLPDGIGYALLAMPHEEDTYAVFEAEAFDVSVEEALRYHIQPVSEELADLLRSAEVYPPALAVARDEVRRVSGATRTEFGEALASCLRRYLSFQRDSPFFWRKQSKQNRATSTWAAFTGLSATVRGTAEEKCNGCPVIFSFIKAP